MKDEEYIDFLKASVEFWREQIRAGLSDEVFPTLVEQGRLKTLANIIAHYGIMMNALVFAQFRSGYLEPRRTRRNLLFGNTDASWKVLKDAVLQDPEDRRRYEIFVDMLEDDFSQLHEMEQIGAVH